MADTKGSFLNSVMQILPKVAPFYQAQYCCYIYTFVSSVTKEAPPSPLSYVTLSLLDIEPDILESLRIGPGGDGTHDIKIVEHPLLQLYLLAL